VGINATRLFTKLYNKRLNVGRVQTPTLAMIAERDVKVKNFTKEKFYVVELDCGEFIAVSSRIDDIVVATKIIADCKGKSAIVSNLKREQKTENPPKLFDLTTLQREANRLFSFSAQETLDITQKLYEKKLVTYPRTDSQFITDDMRESTQKIALGILKHSPFYNYPINSPNVDRVINAKKVQDHHAILPTSESLNVDMTATERSRTFTENEWKIYALIATKLIWATAEKHV
jgi:DNA topoisomerase-3